jgi:enoyl-CoA hydratase
VVPDAKLEEAVESMANKLLGKSPLVLKGMKAWLNRSLDTDLNTFLEMTYWPSVLSFATEDAGEAFAAFQEKRKPVFKGK